jgi:hypothetical protein
MMSVLLIGRSSVRFSAFPKATWPRLSMFFSNWLLRPRMLLGACRLWRVISKFEREEVSEWHDETHKRTDQDAFRDVQPMVMVSDERRVNTHHLCKTHDGSDKDYLNALSSAVCCVGVVREK